MRTIDEIKARLADTEKQLDAPYLSVWDEDYGDLSATIAVLQWVLAESKDSENNKA